MAIVQAKTDADKALTDKVNADRKAADAAIAMATAKTNLEKAVAAAAAAQTSGAAAAQQLRNTLFASDSVVDAAIKKQNDDA